MRTIIQSLVAVAALALLGTTDIKAQSLYHVGQTIKGNGFTYVCETPWMEPAAQFVTMASDIRLRNINNRFTGVAQTLLYGKVILPYNLIERPKLFDSDGYIFHIFHAAVNRLWDEADKQMDENSMLLIDIYVDPSTGKIIDVEFQIDPDDDFARIAPEKYYQVETLLKQSVTYGINGTGMLCNYVYDTFIYRGSWFGKSSL